MFKLYMQVCAAFVSLTDAWIVCSQNKQNTESGYCSTQVNSSQWQHDILKRGHMMCGHISVAAMALAFEFPHVSADICNVAVKHWKDESVMYTWQCKDAFLGSLKNWNV